MWQKHFKHLPKGTKPVTFVGEGAANAVFEIKIPHHGLRDQSFKGKSALYFGANAAAHHPSPGLLLRVAKVPLLGQPTKYNYVWQQNFYQTAILPLLGSHAIHQELVILRNSGIVDELNRLLQDIDHTRKPKFRGSFVGQSDWGLLIEDMRPDPMAPPPRSTLVEFKPKWLSQSRSAPARAVRCRQCALELQRLLTRSCPVSAAGGLPCDRKPCPLALVEDDAPSAVSSPFRIAPKLASSPERARLEPLLQRILRDPFLDDLRAQQENLDLTGPLLASAEDEQFSVAMTLRDCTCFALLPGDSTATEAEVKIRLGDLDWKDPRTKIQHWRGTEQALIDGGFYTADWILYDGVYYYPPTLCLLEWKTRSPAHGKPDIIELQELSTNGDATATTAAHTYKHQADVAALTAMLQPYSGAGSESKPANPYRPPPQ